MKMPDGNKPIKVGDPSYIYKGVYNPIHWIDDKPYRPRVETLVIKDARYVYINLKKNIDKVSPDKRKSKYSIPGGSLDADSTGIAQAEAETNEEALIKVTAMYHSGISYYELYEPGFIAKGGDTPLEYYGSISDVYVGIYDGPYDKSLVEEKDLDPDMAENGRFHKIASVAKYLRKEHVEALLNSQFVATDVKIILRLYRNDIINESTSPIVVPDKFIYHGSNFDIDEFKPMSLDLGNLYDEPGWSTFCFGDYETAKLYGFMKTLQRDLKGRLGADNFNITFNKGRIEISKDDLDLYTDLQDLETKYKFFVYTIDSTGLNIGIGNDPTLKEYTFRESGIIPESKDIFELSMMDVKESIDVVNKYNEPENDSDYIAIQTHDYQREEYVRKALTQAIDDGRLTPGDDITKFMEDNGLSFLNNDISIPDFSVDIENPILETVDLSILIEGKYPIECYGLPDRKAYPMPDEKHVRSAIRFFNHADKSEEKELARNINKKIKEFHMTDVKVGKKNRFKKYFTPIMESCTLDDFSETLVILEERINRSGGSVQEKCSLFNSMKGTIHMMVDYLEGGLIDNVDDDMRENLLEQSYTSFALIDQKKEKMLMEESLKIPNKSRSILYLLEADDKKETNEDDGEKDEEKSKNESGEKEESMDDENESGNAKPKPDSDDNTETEPDSSNDEDLDSDGDDVPKDETPDEDNTDTDDTATDYDAMADEMDSPESDGEESSEDSEPKDESLDEDTSIDDTATDYSSMADEMDTSSDTPDEPEDSNSESAEDNTDTDDNATDYDAMADEMDSPSDTEESDSEESSDDSGDSDSDYTSDDSDSSEDEENNNRYDNKELKNYFLLNSFLSIHETTSDVLDTVSGVILPTPEANNIMAKIVKNLQDIKGFVEKFIQFHFNNADYAFNLYYYNILISALKMNLNLLEEAMNLGEDNKIKRSKKED